MINPLFRLVVITIVIYNIIPLVFICSARKVQYISTEHPTVLYYDRKYFKYVKLTSQRYVRSNPFYLVGFHAETLVTIGNNVTASFYFYEFLSNVYKRGFIEMHFGFCDLLKKDNFFGAPMRQGAFLRPCPYPPGQYHAYNMSIDVRVIPPGFPFRKGRIYCNVTLAATKQVIGLAFIDMELKDVHMKDPTNIINVKV